jgi:two-component system OmpR family sensor kinase
MPLRLKLLVAVIVLVFAGLAVSDVVTYTSLKSFLLQRVDQQLIDAQHPVSFAINRQAKGGFGPLPGPGDFGSLPPGTFGEALDAAGKIIGGAPVVFRYGAAPPTPNLPSPLPLPGASIQKPHFFTTGAGSGSPLKYRVSVARVPLDPVGQGTLIVAIPLIEVGQTLHRLVLIAGLVTLAVLLGLGAISWWLVRRGLRPLEEMGVTAGAIAAGDLSRRVPQEDPRTEVGRLGVALNAMLAQIEQAFAERKASEERLRRFLADASHELRTPLTSIRGYAELFRRGASKREHDLAKSMRRIEDESRRMGIMVEDLLLLARLDQDRPLEREPVDLAAIAADAVEDAKASAGEREITLEVSGPVPVLGDEARLRQVAVNLVSNAVAHTPPGTPVTVRAMSEGEDVALEVADRGPGLSPEQMERAFEPFYRSDPSRDRSTGGAGLGLAIVEAIAKAHGGTVSVAATPGGGATFRVLLPRENGQFPTSEEAPLPGDAIGETATEPADELPA